MDCGVCFRVVVSYSELDILLNILNVIKSGMYNSREIAIVSLGMYDADECSIVS